MKKLFLLLCILGIVLPYYHLINFLILNEGSMEGFFSDIFSTHPMGMISMDLTVAATTFLIFLIRVLGLFSHRGALGQTMRKKQKH